MDFKYCKIVVFTPPSHTDIIRKVLAENGAGHIGKYDSCSFSSKGIGRFRGLEGSNQFIGAKGLIEEVSEEKIETICETKLIDTVIKAVKKAHPYEEPAIDIIPLLNQ